MVASDEDYPEQKVYSSKAKNTKDEDYRFRYMSKNRS